jgi:CelD/BcsL family acetyltransferase involved in cellulose biosynthesis
MTANTRLALRDDWLSLAKRATNATFFHTPHWHDIAVETWPAYRDRSLLVRLDNGQKAVLPLLVAGTRARGLLRRVLSSFGGCYGGPLSDSLLRAEDHLQIQRCALTARTGTLSIVGNALSPGAAWLPAFKVRPMSTHLLELDGDFHALLKNFSKGHRAAYTKGLRLGLKARRATSERDVDAYYALYESSLTRWGERATSRYPRGLFAAIFRLSQRQPELCTIWLVSRDGQDLAGGVMFYWNLHAVYWHGAMDEKFISESPSNTLVGEMIRDATERGFRFFDFNPSGGHEQVAAFKRRFGAKEVAFERADYTSTGLRLLAKLRGGP